MGVFNISDNKRIKSIHIRNQINLMNINSKYIIQKIFDNLKKLKTLKISNITKKFKKE